MSKKLWLWSERLFLGLVFFLALVFFLYHLLLARRVIPRVYVSGLGEFSFLKETEVQQKIAAQIPVWEKKEQVFDFGVAQFTLTATGLGLTLSATDSARAVYRLGRSGDLGQDLGTEARALSQGLTVSPEYSLKEDIYAAKIDEIYAAVAGRPASFKYQNGLDIESEKEGLAVTREDLGRLILFQLLKFEPFHKFDLPSQKPNVGTKDLRPRFAEVQKILVHRPRVVFAGRDFTFSEAELLGLLAPASEASPSVALDKLADWVRGLATKINRPTRAHNFRAEGGRVVEFRPGRDGFVVNEPESVDLIAKATLAANGRVIKIPVARLAAPVNKNDYGLESLLAVGKSNFAGSIPGRVRNIKRASKQMSGVLVAPDEVFSFNGSLGEVSDRTGYDYAYIIKEGRTVLGTGGGVCQVSTTLFRAVLKAGLPIVSRSAHAYRVHYYENDSGPGLDATVFAPSVDLRFKNDTGSFLLLTTQIEAEDLSFHIYGRADGRRVTLTEPKTLSQSPAPASLYQEDSTLPKGNVKQVDFAASGATVVFERKVTKNGELLYEDRFTSIYRPWRAIYLVGTGV